MNLHAMLFGLFGSCLLLLAGVTAADFGGSLKHTMERAAQQEVKRKADRETRLMVRCVMGEPGCDRADHSAPEADNDRDVSDEEAPASNLRRTDVSGGQAMKSDTTGVDGGHPLITPYRGSVRKERHFDAYNEYVRIVGRKGKSALTERLEGALTRIKYANPKGRSSFEIERNYRDSLTARGFRIDYECVRRTECGNTDKPGWAAINGLNLGIAGDVRYVTGRMKHGRGEVYVSVAVNPSVTYVHVLETAAMDEDMVGVNAESLAAGLEKEGRVRLDGIYFDTGMSVLKPASNPSLDQAALLMRQQPALKLLVAGHTDNVGNDAANRQLAKRRAEAVRDSLLARGIPSARLTAQGYGSDIPVAANDSESGRAQNRRVELVKQ